jgi:hypothetical protein
MEEKVMIPKAIFDKEYSTQWKREVQFLEEKGINYTYAKKHYKYPVIRYKYTKTPELFLALAEFYNQVRYRQTMDRIDKTTKELLPIEKGCIDINIKDLTDPEKKLLELSEDVENLLKDNVNQLNGEFVADNDDTE